MRDIAFGFLAICLAVSLTDGCARSTAPQGGSTADARRVADNGYMDAPVITSSRREGAAIVLSGRAVPASRIMLGGGLGRTVSATADAEGRWNVAVEVDEAPRMLTLRATTGDQVVRFEQDLLATPSGRVVTLRAGAGAVTSDPPGTPRMAAFDFDSQGAAVVSGAAPTGALLSLRLNGRQVGTGRVEASGWFHMPLPQPISGLNQKVEVLGDTFQLESTFDVTPAAALAGGAYRVLSGPDAVRVDWTTPGGGVQSTWVLN